jgi:hypothetical protein
MKSKQPFALQFSAAPSAAREVLTLFTMDVEVLVSE